MTQQSRSKEPECSGTNVDAIAWPTTRIVEHRFGKVVDNRIRVSVIYNYYSKESTIFESLGSLEKQDWRSCSADEVEVIIVDDGTVGEDVADRLPEHIIYLWQRKKGYGICRAKNTGAKLANGDILVFLDPDILVSPRYIDTIIAGIRRFGPNTVLCGYIWDYHFIGCPDPRTEFGVWERPDRATRRFYQIAGGNMAMTRSLFSQTMGFDEDLIYGGVEDLLFGYHVSKLPGTTVAFLRDMEGHHIPHPPSPAHANPGSSWDIVKRKWPEFYNDYIVVGLR